MTNRSLKNPSFDQARMPLRSREFGVRIVIFSVLWLLLAKWQLSSLLVGCVFIIGASLLSLYLAPSHLPTRRAFKSPLKLLSFLFFFFSQSLRGGWEIAKTALTPRLTLSPGVVKYRTDLIDDSRVFAFMQILSLLPGTVSAGRDGRELSIHVLDMHSFKSSDVQECEVWVTKFLSAQEKRLLSPSES